MYYRKKIVLTDESKKVYQTADLTMLDGQVKVSVGSSRDPGAELAVYCSGKLTLCGKTPCSYTVYTSGEQEVHVGILSKAGVLATGSTEGTHDPRLFTREINSTKEKSIPPSLSDNRISNDSSVVSNEKEEKSVLTSDTAPPKSSDKKEDTPIPDSQNEDTSDQIIDPIESFHAQLDQSGAVTDFYCSIKSNLEEMLTCYPKEERLNELIDESEWVKVERTDGFYAVGLIKSNGKAEYVCYGVPGKLDELPPESLRRYCQWIPTDENDNGYWTLFQDAKTGVAIKNG